MPSGALVQLVVVGQVDSHLSINPDFSYYKYSYKKHSNFAFDNVKLLFDNNPVLAPRTLSQYYNCKITINDADLLSNLYFCFNLPDIYSSDKYRFKWIKNVGSFFIKNAYFYIDNTLIDQTTGEWLIIWNELSRPLNDNKYDKITGNIDELTNPKLNYTRVTIKNNKFIYNYYPESDINDINASPSIKGRQITLPLNFWFSKNPSLALPITRLKFNNIYVKLEIELSENLYQVYSSDLDMYISPIYYNQLYNDNIDINSFTRNISLNPYIDALYVYLTTTERNLIIEKSTITYLVEQLNITTTTILPSNTSSTHNINLVSHNATKEIIWTTKRDDCSKFNEYTNFTASIPENSESSILHTASIIWNNTNIRIDEREATFFNMIQPYQYHTRIPRQGIYTYSFALYPEKEFLSGYYNGYMVNTSLRLILSDEYNNDYVNNKLSKINKTQYNFNYLINIYCLSYNIFEIVGGQFGMKFV